jgi:uncharacterized protein YifN (PemK superfamily)
MPTPTLRPPHRGGRPLTGPARRVPISIRLDPDVLAALRDEAETHGLKYQTLIHNILTGRKQFADYLTRWQRSRHLVTVTRPRRAKKGSR